MTRRQSAVCTPTFTMALRALRPPRGMVRTEWARLSRFQQEVYRAVCTIPKGQTRSYQWVARAIRRPRAARAVGNALNRNPFSPRIPCHRVVRADGSLGGFAGGVDKKRRLLGAERRATIPTSAHTLVEC